MHHRHICVHTWTSLDQLRHVGFYVRVAGEHAQLTFHPEAHASYLSLSLTSAPESAQPAASRITEVEPGLRIADRTRCKHWLTTATTTVIMEFEVRFDQAIAPPGLTANLGLWNAPLPSKQARLPELPIPMTAVGVSRSGQQYVALVAQDFNLLTGVGLYERVPLPEWLDASAWHRIRTVLTYQEVRIELAQGGEEFTPILMQRLPHPLEPMAFEFSIDNDNFPQSHAPITIPDSLHVRSLEIRGVDVRL